MKRSTFPSYGHEAFPRRARAGQRIGQTPLRRCGKCGHPNDTRSVGWADNGEGLGPATAVTVDGVTQGYDHPNVNGCPFCGSLHWLNAKPKALPDDRYFPSDESKYYRRRRR